MTSNSVSNTLSKAHGLLAGAADNLIEPVSGMEVAILSNETVRLQEGL